MVVPEVAALNLVEQIGEQLADVVVGGCVIPVKGFVECDAVSGLVSGQVDRDYLYVGIGLPALLRKTLTMLPMLT